MTSPSEFMESPEFKKLVFTQQVIVAAMMLGVAIFMGIAVFIGQSTPPPATNPGPHIFLYVGLAMTAMALLARVVVLKVLLNSFLRSFARGTWKPPLQTKRTLAPETRAFLEQAGDAGTLCRVFMSRNITSAAMLEGPAFFMIVTYIIERRVESLAVAAALLAGLALQFPTATGVGHWITAQLQAVEQMRRDGGDARPVLP